MAITGTGTQADPFIVHSYSEFISLSNSDHQGTATVYVKWFDEPNQVLNCNDYGSEFKWGTFENGTNGRYAKYTVDIDLNGATIKNLIVAPDSPMFKTYSRGGSTGSLGIINVRNGSIRNVFMGSATSRITNGAVNFYDVSLSVNVAGVTEISFLGLNTTSDSIYRVNINNCALYLVASALGNNIMKYANITDSDIELHVANQNNKAMFPDSTFTDCRFTGKVGGVGQTFEYNTDTCVLDWCGMNGKTLNFTNCVVDLDLTDGRILGYTYSGSKYDVFLAYNGNNFGTNVVCNSHRPIDEGHEQYYSAETAWNFMSHENIRNGTYLNNAGFTVVEVVGS